MKYISTLMVVAFLGISSLSAQIDSRQLDDGLLSGSAFLKGSSNFLEDTGLVYPRTDLTSFTFSGSDNNGYDGMVVYNTASGTTQATGAGVGGQAVEKGLYYFDNPNGSNFGNPTDQGEWIALGGGAGSGKFVDGDVTDQAVYTDGNVGVGTTSPNASAVLDLESTTQGFLAPRMTTAERDAIVTPADGLVIYNTSVSCIEIYRRAAWFNICTQENTSEISGNTLIGLPLSLCQNDIRQSYGTGDVIPQPYTYNGDFYAGGTGGSGFFEEGRYILCYYEVDQTSENNKYPTDPADLSGKIWLDRHVGAYSHAESPTDVSSFGDLYQWGRPEDGHAKRYQRTFDVEEGPATSGGVPGTMANGTSNVQSDNPTTTDFIIGFQNWRVTPDNTLWQGNASDYRNPCPSGYRLPTRLEGEALENWMDLVGTGSVDERNVEGTDLGLPLTGYRDRLTGDLLEVIDVGYFWTNQGGGLPARVQTWGGPQFTNNLGASEAEGYPVRCVRD